MKAIIFSRVSTMIQDLQQQEQALLEAAKADGFKDSDIITISEHESAVKNDISERLGISKAKEAIQNQDVKVIYAFELSRIARRLDVFYEFRKFLVDNKVQLKIINPKVCLLNEAGEIDENFTLVFSIFASLAEQEARLMQARFKRGKQKLRDNHLWVGAGIPFGYTVNKNKEYVIKEDEAEIIREIFSMYETMTVVDIAKELVMSGKYDGSVNSAQVMVRNILHREYYTGRETNYNGYKEVNHTYKFPAIISGETFDRTKERLFERRKYCKTKSKHTYLCRGLLVNINNEQLKPQSSHNSYSLFKVGKYHWETLSVNIQLIDSIVLHYSIENRKKHSSKDIANIKAKLLKEIQSIDSKISNIKKSITLEQDKQIKVEMRFISGKISESTADSLNIKIQESIEHLIKMNNDLEIDKNNISERLQMLNRKTAAHDNPLFIEDYTNISQIVHQEIKKVIIIKGKKRFDYTLGIEFINGDYQMIDVNTRFKKVWSESGEEVQIKNLVDFAAYQVK